MDANRKTAIIVGVLFIIGTVAGILSVVVTGPIFDDSDYLTKAAANGTQIILGSLLVLIMGFALAMIPAMLFPIFKRYNEALALGAGSFQGGTGGRCLYRCGHWLAFIINPKSNLCKYRHAGCRLFSNLGHPIAGIRYLDRLYVVIGF